MKKIFSLFVAVLMATVMFAGRTFSAGDVLYMNCNAVSWWCNDDVTQTMYFLDAANTPTAVVGEVHDATAKIYKFNCPAGTFEYIYEQRGTWNKTGNISLAGTEGKDYIKLFAENSATATWGNINDAPAEDETHYLYVTDGSVHWDNLYVYAWGGKEWFGAWPGANVRSFPQENGAYKLPMTGQPGGAVNLIFHNNVEGHQYNSDVYNFTADHNVTTLDPDAPLEVAGVALWPTSAVLPTTIPAEVKVLSLNNSLIHYENEWQDDHFNQMAAAMNKNATWTAHTNLGKSLQYHYDEGEGLTEAGTPSARKLIRDNAYTHIILQEQTTKPLTNFAGFRESVIDWVSYIRTQGANPNAVIIMPINWALVNGENAHTNNATLKQTYLDLAQELGLVLSPVGVAYELAYTADATVMAQGNRWFKDDRHPTQMTTYLGAVLEYATIFGVDPTTITWKPSTVTEEEATRMRSLAKQAIEATDQPVNIYNHSIRFEVRVIDPSGISISKTGATYSGAQMTDSTFTCATAGDYTVNATCGTTNLSSTVKVADMNTVVITVPAIAVDDEHLVAAQAFDTIAYPAADAAEAIAGKGVYGLEANLPFGWRVERNQVGPRTIGAYADASVTTQYQGGASLPSGASNGTWNLGMPGNPDRAIGGMTTGVANGARTINVMAHYTNTGASTYDTLRIAYDIEKYREGSNANLFYVKLFTSTNGVAWTEAGDAFTWLNPAGSGQTGFETVPGFTQHVAADLTYHFAAGTDLYLCWSISTSAGDNCASAPCLAIDNVNIEFVKAAAPAAAHYIYVDDQTGWETLGLYAYGTSTLYGAWPGVTMQGTETIDGVTYKVFPYDVTTPGSYSIIFNNWNQGSQTPAPDFVLTEARDYYLTVKLTGITEVGDEPVIPEPDYAAIELTAAAAAYSQNFDELPYPAADATVISGFNGAYGLGTTLPQGWRAERNEAGPRVIGAYANASDTLQYQGGVSLPSNAKNGTWNLGMNGSSDRAVGGMTTGAAGGARTINIMAFLKNTDEAREITELAVNYDIEKYRDGSNANEFYVKLFTSKNGVDWTAAEGDAFTFTNPKGDAQTGFAEVPAATTPAAGTLAVTLPAGDYLHLCWSICTSAGSDCQAAPCLAIDNVQITATYAEQPVVSLENTSLSAPLKRMINGQLVIEKNGRRYNALGQQL